jgi:hypothetical protein
MDSKLIFNGLQIMDSKLTVRYLKTQMNNSPDQTLQAEKTEKQVPSTLPLFEEKQIPKFPDRDIPIEWIWPPFAGRKILNKVFKYTLKPRLQTDDTWVINAKNDWYCFSKSDWLYTNADEAQEALRDNMRKHLQCSPILSEQRCVVIATDIKYWRLWQIVHHESTLAENLASALHEKQLDKLALETFRCATRYADALLQSISFPPLLNLSLENLGMDAKIQLVYLSTVDEQAAALPTQTAELIEFIKQTFAAPIAKALPYLDATAVKKEFEKIDGFEQAYLIEILTQLFSSTS